MLRVFQQPARRAALTAAFFAAALAAIAPAAASQENRSAADSSAWIGEAVDLSSSGRWTEAEDLLDEALSYLPADSDLLYLRALARVKNGRPLDGALGDLAASRNGTGFSRYSERDAALLQAELLVRERRWKEALAAVASSYPSAAVDPAYHLVRAKALAGLGEKSAYLDEIRSSMDRFPDDPSFPRLFLSRVGSVPASAAEKAVGELIVERAGRYASSDPEIPVLASPLMPYATDRENAVRAFRATGGRSPAATLRALEYGIIDEAQAASELLGGTYAVRLGDMTTLLSLLRTPAARKSTAAAVATWSGAVEADRDGDGAAEERFELSRGLVSSWRLDADQDGDFETSVAFKDGLPASVDMKSPGISLAAEYGAFPDLAAARFSDGNGSRTYAFGPGAYPFSPLGMRIFAGEGRDAIYLPEPRKAEMPSERSCALAALSVRSEAAAAAPAAPTPAGTEYSVSALERGIVISSRTYRGGRLYSTTDYARGALSVERIDEDGDGRFETERLYEPSAASGSVLAWARVDTDGDGAFDYREQAAFPYRKEWDYDGDGAVDAAQFLLKDGATRGEFSSRLDGRLDESVTVKDGRVSGLTRDGKPLTLTPDANPSVTWIGTKPFDLGSNLPRGEGFFKQMGKRYRLVRVGGMAFAEVVP
jgi:hypothetical protein